MDRPLRERLSQGLGETKSELEQALGTVGPLDPMNANLQSALEKVEECQAHLQAAGANCDAQTFAEILAWIRVAIEILNHIL